MSRPIWLVNLIKKAFPGRFLAARLTKVPVIGAIVDGWLFNGDDIIYLPVDTTIQINERVENSDEMILPSQIVDHFINQANFHWIMNFCICRDSSHCQEYPANYGCLFLGEAVLKINPRLGRLVTREEALDHARRCREAGLVHMIGRNKLDTVWLGATPGQKLMTICNCCPCCCLWKILPHIDTTISRKVTKMPGVSVSVTEQCLGCGTCTEGVCFVDAIRLVDGTATIGEDCRGCGRCVEICPNQAIELRIEDDTFIRKTVERLSALVNVT
jgi:ferredoxin